MGKANLKIANSRTELESATLYAAVLPSLTERIGVYELVLIPNALVADVEQFKNQFYNIPYTLPPRWANGEIKLDNNVRIYRITLAPFYELIISRLECFCKDRQIELVTGEVAQKELTNLLPNIIESIFEKLEPSEMYQSKLLG